MIKLLEQFENAVTTLNRYYYQDESINYIIPESTKMSITLNLTSHKISNDEMILKNGSKFYLTIFIKNNIIGINIIGINVISGSICLGYHNSIQEVMENYPRLDIERNKIIDQILNA